MFMFAVNLALCVASILLLNIYPYLVRSYNISTNVYFLCELFKVFAVLHQNLAYMDFMGEILHSFQSIELLFRSILQYPIQFSLCERAYKKKLCWSYGSYAVLIIFVTIYNFLYGKTVVSEILTEVMKFISITVCMYVLLFVDLMTFYLKHLNTIIEKEISERRADNEFVFVVTKVGSSDMIRKHMSNYKMIYLRLWKVSEQLNEYFGWTLLTVMLLSFVDLVISTLWQLKELNDISKIMRITRNNHSKCY